MAPPPQLPPVDRSGITNYATYHARHVHTANMHLAMRRLREEGLLEQKVPPVIGIEHTSRCIEKIDGEGYALYQTILENPYDLAPRLIYADWLREHGDEERADFIQRTIELKDYDLRTALYPAIRSGLDPNECRRLLDKNLTTWHGMHPPVMGKLFSGASDLPYGDVNLYWRNGFVDSIYFKTLHKHTHILSNLAKIHPIRAVGFETLIPLPINELINTNHSIGQRTWLAVLKELAKEFSNLFTLFFFENGGNIDYMPNVRKAWAQNSQVFHPRPMLDPSIIPQYLFPFVHNYGYKLSIRGCEFLVFDGKNAALSALSNGAIDCARKEAGLPSLTEHPKTVFNFKIDDPWFNPEMRGRLPYYRYPTGISARLEDRPTLHNWVQSAMLPIPPDWVRDQLGLPFIQTDDKKEGE